MNLSIEQECILRALEIAALAQRIKEAGNIPGSIAGEILLLASNRLTIEEIHKEVDARFRHYTTWVLFGPSLLAQRYITEEQLVDWKSIEKKYKFAAIDRSGRLFVYRKRPELNVQHGTWDHPLGAGESKFIKIVTPFAWHRTLQIR